jgi:diguanylate cyclase (GGDEF)-like protein
VRILNWLEKRSLVSVLTFAIVLIAIIGIVDYATGSDIDVDAFYLLPIVIAAWCGGRKVGWMVALLAACVSFAAEAIFRGNGHLKPFVYWNALVALGYFLPVMYLTTAIRIRLIFEEKSARADPLTGANNGRSFRELMELELARCRRKPQPLTLVFLDLDNFKEVNDRWGHERGDVVLCQAVAAMRSDLRPMDVVGRLGGDEFAILMPITDPDEARAAVPRLRTTLLEAMQREAMPVTFSIGVASFLAPPESVDSALRLADALMYSVKQRGKNEIEYATFRKTAEQVSATP